MWDWYRDGQLHEGHYAPYISYTSGFRSTDYNPDMDIEGAVIYGLEAFPMNLNIDVESMEILVKLILAARDEVIEEAKAEIASGGRARLKEKLRRASRGTVENLVSGVTRRTHRG